MVATLGRWANGKARDYAYALGFFFQVLKETALFMRRKQVAFRVLVLQILFTGVEAMNIVALIALAFGAVIIVEGGTVLPRFGQTSLLYSILIVVITRELGPILTAFIIIARSGPSNRHRAGQHGRLARDRGIHVDRHQPDRLPRRPARARASLSPSWR